MSSGKRKKIPGSIKIQYSDEKGNRIFEWKQNRSGNNVETGIYEMLEFFKRKLSIDIVKHIEEYNEMHKKIDIPLKNNTHIQKGDEKNDEGDK